MIPPINVVGTGKKIFFASDFHLGAPNYAESRVREDKIIRWLDHITPQAQAVFLLGDIFDFWFEYKHVVPKGFVRLQGKLAQLTDSGIPVYFFTGNHDMWMFDYFSKELNIPVFREPQILHVGNVKLLIGHGDGLGKGDYAYKFLKKIFANKLCQWAFRWLHPNLGMTIANGWSGHSRLSNQQSANPLTAEKDWLWGYCKTVEQTEHHDFYIFGHQHLPLDLPVGKTSRYINLGEWISTYTFAHYDGNQLVLDRFA